MTSKSNNPLSTLTGARQTMLSWAKVIESYAVVPEVYQDSCKPLLADSHPFPYMVLAPAISGNRHTATEKLLCEVDDVFYMWERVGRRIVSTAYPLKTICALEVGSILLYSWLTIRGLTSAGTASSTIIPFNTATGRHLAPFIHKMRPAPTAVDEAGWQAELAKFDYLAAASFKFMNYARESLVRGEKVIQTVWQPPIRQHRFTLFGRSFHRTIALAHLALLTDQEVIFIGDDKQSVDNRGVRYGGIWQYIPLRHIAAATLTEPAEDWVTLSLTLAGGGQRLEKVFAAFNQPALEHFQQELKHRLG
jgi:hypothetical protein